MSLPLRAMRLRLRNDETRKRQKTTRLRRMPALAGQTPKTFGPVANFRAQPYVDQAWNLPLQMLRSEPMILNAIAEKLKRQSKDDFKGRHFENETVAGIDGTIHGPDPAVRPFRLAADGNFSPCPRADRTVSVSCGGNPEMIPNPA